MRLIRTASLSALLAVAVAHAASAAPAFDYEGATAEGAPHGQGTAAYADGSRYEGEWQHGQRHGQGTMSWPGGARYEEIGRAHV